jgi:hypothetical protein
MTQPLRVNCPSIADVPPAERLDELATDEQHVVLQFPPTVLTEPNGTTKESLVARLQAALPDCCVFESGGDQNSRWVTVMRVDRAGDVAAHMDEFVAALRLFRRTATTLATRLAARLGVAPGVLLRALKPGGSPPGRLDEWDYQPHGGECRFVGRATGQVVEVRLTFGEEFGALDPYFFGRFVRSTPGLEGLARLIRDEYHDTARVLELVGRAGYLREERNGWRRGWVVRDDGPA